MKVDVTSLQHDIHIHRTPVPKDTSTSQRIEDVERLRKERKGKGKKIQYSKIDYPLEDYHMDRYTIIRDWVLKNPSR